MKLNWSGFTIFIQGNVTNTNLDYKVFNIVCFCSCVVNLLAFAFNFFIEAHYLNLLLPFLAFIGYTNLFLISRFAANHQLLHSFYVIITQLYISFFWFFNAGLNGVIPFIQIGVFIMYLASTSHKKYLLITSVVILNLLALIYFEFNFPSLVFNYATKVDRFLDLAFMYSLILTLLGICIYFYKKTFEEEKTRNERNSIFLAETKSDLKIKKIIENSTDAVITTDPEGIILEWNISADKIFNYEAAFAKGKKLSDLIIPAKIKENFDNAVSYFKEKTNFIRFETAATNQKGEVFPVELSMTQIEYEDKTLLNFFIRNIKERKESEEKILKKNKQLLTLNEEMDSFIYRTSHDLRTPITNISSLLDIFYQSDEDEKAEIIHRTKSNVERLIKILDDLSNYSKNHRNELLYQNIDMKKIVAFVKEKLALLPHFDKLVIQLTEIGHYEFVSDIERLKVLFLNIIENALIFRNLEKQDILVEILIDKRSEKTIISIKDNGEGIKAESVSKIFNMFFRGSVRSNGSGLGLYIAKRILNKLGGKIEVLSQKGIGTEFIIEIPNNIDDIVLKTDTLTDLNPL